MNSFAELGLSAPPQRVVSLVPSVTETLIEFGLAECLIGRTNYCVYPAEKVSAIPALGGTKNPAITTIIAAKPDLVIANQEENRKADIETLRAAGLKVWVTFPQTVTGAIGWMWETINLFRAVQLGPSLTILEKSIEWATLAAENAQPVRVFCPIWREPQGETGRPQWWMTLNHDTYAHDLLRICGAENIFANRERRYPLEADLGMTPPLPPDPERDTRYPRVTHTEMLALQPELILLPTEPYPFSEADMAAFDELPDARIEVVDGSWLTWPGIRLDRAIRELPALINAQPLPSNNNQEEPE